MQPSVRIAIFLTNHEPATPLLRALAASLRTFRAEVMLLNPDRVDQRERARFDGAIAMEGVDVERITTYAGERIAMDGKTKTKYTAPNFAGVDDTIVLGFKDGKLEVDIEHRYSLEEIENGDLSRFLLFDRPSKHIEVVPHVEPEKQPAETDMSGLPPPAKAAPGTTPAPAPVYAYARPRK